VFLFSLVYEIFVLPKIKDLKIYIDFIEE